MKKVRIDVQEFIRKHYVQIVLCVIELALIALIVLMFTLIFRYGFSQTSSFDAGLQREGFIVQVDH
jgi:Na+/H+-dicarboxylate symporter